MCADVVVPLVRADSTGSDEPALIVLDARDSVGVAGRTLKAGEKVLQAGRELQITQRIAVGHKVALADIAAGERVLKYAQMIGVARAAIAAGEHVHTHNLDFAANDVQEASQTPVAGSVSTTDTFAGYRRADGRFGTRNYIAVLSSVNCSATVAHRIAAGFSSEPGEAGPLSAYPDIDGVAAFTHGTGCGMAATGEGFDNLQRVIGGYARHPNIGGVLVVGLGCETSQIASTLDAEALATGPLLRTMNIQTSGGTAATIERGRELICEMLDAVNAVSREPCPASGLTLALQCGGSDAWSGITANPALGVAADLLVAQGGTAVLAETPEIYGAEHLLTRRAISEDVADALMQRVQWWQAYVTRHGGSLDNNPSPGNKLGGLTTILEKSLGAVAKGGTTPLTAVYRYAEPITARGFVFMDSPGYDPASVTGQIAGGCNLVAFTTGRGSAFGSKPAPCSKIATNTSMAISLAHDMDIDAGSIVSGDGTVESVGRTIYEHLLQVASGSATRSEQQGLGDHEFVPWQIGAVM